MQLLPAHPALIARSNQLSFGLIVVLRSFFWIAAILALDGLLELGTSVAALAAMAVVGVLTASLLAFSRLTTLGFILLLLMLYIGYQVSFELLQFLPTSTTSVFLLYNLLQHTNNLFGAFVLAAISSWFFWRHEQTATWEILSLCFLGVYLLSGHRNFHFDTPALINNLAWSFGVEHLSMLIILGTAILLFALIYLFFATLPSRPIAGKSDKLTRSHWGRHTILSRAVPAIALITLIFVVARQVFNHYSATAASITANGVGQKAEEGLSPLSFHSALGSTNQPSALVRLEGDYATNPFSPMLYLRESALSDFNGHEMVLAGEGFDSDIAKTRPEEPFIGKEDVSLTYRTPLEQSIFLLTEHDYAFAVDYPIAIKRLKNPDTARFNAAFKAYSMAPAYSLEQLKGHTVGDERWSKGQLDHYITPHADRRYADLAHELSKGIKDPIEQANAITKYLSKNAIYTLAPNHEVGKDQDPVAPFLFGDMRGYCVHFAHATVYLARALGIPARIGTGYMTDLSQAKDGHILLRMSDRHAWAEIYVAELGWVPFDIQPEQVESHAETPVDQGLLEELMDLVGPGQELLPDESFADEESLQSEKTLPLPQLSDFTYPLLALIVVLFLLKLYLRFSWLIPAGPQQRFMRAYRALLSMLLDLGYHRREGETRAEFAERMNAVLKQPSSRQPLASTQLYLLARYSLNGISKVSQAEVDLFLSEDRKSLSHFAKWRRIVAFLNPVSIVRFVSRGAW